MKYKDNIKSATCVAMQGECLCLPLTHVTVNLIDGITQNLERHSVISLE